MMGHGEAMSYRAPKNRAIGREVEKDRLSRLFELETLMDGLKRLRAPDKGKTPERV
jgi:hypothetical protein